MYGEIIDLPYKSYIRSVLKSENLYDEMKKMTTEAIQGGLYQIILTQVSIYPLSYGRKIKIGITILRIFLQYYTGKYCVKESHMAAP